MPTVKDWTHQVIVGAFVCLLLGAACTVGGNRAAPTQAAAKARNDAGNNKVYFTGITGWVAREDTSDGVHPTITASRR